MTSKLVCAVCGIDWIDGHRCEAAQLGIGPHNIVAAMREMAKDYDFKWAAIMRIGADELEKLKTRDPVRAALHRGVGHDESR